jgi:hypothetical protein
MQNKQTCVYCGERPGTTDDHVPPRAFFQRQCPNNAQLLTAPCCEQCRVRDQRDDPLVRDVLAGLLETEATPYVREHVTGRVSRSIQRGGQNFRRIVEILKAKEITVMTSDGPAVANLPALNLDAPEFDRFFERVGRAVLHEAYDRAYFSAETDWIPKVKMPEHFSTFMLNNAPHRSILDQFFYCATPVISGNIQYVYVVFYQSINFLIRFREKHA